MIPPANWLQRHLLATSVRTLPKGERENDESEFFQRDGSVDVDNYIVVKFAG